MGSFAFKRGETLCILNQFQKKLCKFSVVTIFANFSMVL